MLAFLLGFAGLNWAQETGQEERRQTSNQLNRPLYKPSNLDIPVNQVGAGMRSYLPPRRGKPVHRIGGGTRGPGANENASAQVEASQAKLVLLVPEELSFTFKAQPVLVWYIADPMQASIQTISVLNLETQETVFFKNHPVDGQGLHAIDLAEFSVQLQPLVEYYWTVTLQVDPNNYLNNIIAGASIMRLQPEAAELAQLNDYTNDQYPLVALKGFWYDALAMLYREFGQPEAETAIKQDLQRLLKQVDLREPAAFLEAQSNITPQE